MAPANIYIIGAQCTGKTTLVNALKDYLTRYREQDTPDPIIISEVARNVLKELKIDRHDIANSPAKSLELQTAILKAQCKAEGVAKDAGWYISDRSGLDPIVYARLSVGEDAAQTLLNSADWATLERNMKEGRVFVCEAGCEWLIDDGVRWLPDDSRHWDEFDRAFRNLLEQRKINFQVVPRDVTQIHERVEMVLARSDQTDSLHAPAKQDSERGGDGAMGDGEEVL